MGLFSRVVKAGNDDVSFVLYPDAGRGNIQALLITHGETPLVIASLVGKKKVDIDKVDHRLPDLLSSVSYAVVEGKKLLEAAQVRDQRHYKLMEVLIVLPGPYYLLHTATLRYESEKPVTVTERLLDEIKKQHKAKPLETEVVGGEASENALETVRNRIIAIKVNGYTIVQPLGSVGTTIEITAATMTVEREVKDALEAEVKKVFNTSVKLDSVAYASFNVLSQRMHVGEHFLGVVVGADLTEILYVIGGVVRGSISFPFGQKKIIQMIARSLKQTSETLIETLHLYHDKKLSEDKARELELVFEKGSEEWLDAFSKALIDVLEGMPPPRHIYFLEDADLSVFFNYTISRHSALSHIFAPQGFETKAIDTLELGRGLFRIAPQVFMNQLLALLALFALRHDQPQK